MPFMNVYGSSKSFMNNFSLALHKEWQSKGIFVQTLVPGPTQSEFDQTAQAYTSSLGKYRASPDSVVNASIQGLHAQLPLVTTQPRLKLQRVWASLAPLQHVLTKLSDMFKPPSKVS